MQPSSPSAHRAMRYWCAFVVLILLVLLACGAAWAFDHGGGTYWDESHYLNEVELDRQSWEADGPIGLVKRLANQDVSRPPAYRLLALPLVAVGATSPGQLRLVSLLTMLFISALTYLAGRSVAGRSGGLFGVFVLAAMPLFLGTLMRFGTEYVLLPAIAGLVAALLVSLDRVKPNRWAWWGLAASVALGCLAKLTFAVVVGPMLLVVLILVRRGKLRGPSPRWLVTACLTGVALMAPLGVLRGRDWLAYARYSAEYEQHELTWTGRAREGAQSFLGRGVLVVILVVVLVLVVRLLTARSSFDRRTKAALLICLSGAVSLPLFSLLGSNNNMRLVFPAAIPLAIGFGIAASASGLTKGWRGVLIGGVLATQLAVIVLPSADEPRYQTGDRSSGTLLNGNETNVLAREEIWDWDAVRDLVRKEGYDDPVIAYFGSVRPFNLEAIAAPWIRHGTDVKVKQLWSGDDAGIDWKAIDEKILASDIVITAPGASETGPHTDANNRELVRHLDAQGFSDEPLTASVGRFVDQDVLLFLQDSDK